MADILSASSFYASVEDFKIREAELQLRSAYEIELFRHCWLDQVAYVPISMYRAVHLRTIASLCEPHLGDYDAALKVMSPRMFRDLLWLLSDLPCRDLDACMKAMAYLSGKPSKKGARRGS